MKEIEFLKMESIQGGGKNADCRFLGGVWLGGLLTGPLSGWGFGVATGAWAAAYVMDCFE